VFAAVSGEGGAILEIAVESEYISKVEFDMAIAVRDEAARTLFGLIRSVTQKIENGELGRRQGLRSRTADIAREKVEVEQDSS
jgi:hypothetical protein